MTEPEPIYSTNGDDADRIAGELRALRQHTIGLTIAAERLLESLGHPVESAIVTRRERRANLTSQRRKRNM